jgi:hypothetical protein
MLDATNQNDFDRWEEFYVRDDSFSISGFAQEPIFDFERYKNAVKFFHEDGIVEEGRSFTDIKVRVSGDTAWATLRDRFIRKGPNSRDKKLDYHSIYTLVKHDELWLINNISQTAQNIKRLTRYMIRYSNGIRLETYLPLNDMKPGNHAVTGGRILHEGLVEKVEPVYPEAARAAGVSGDVVFLVTFDEDGSVFRAIRLMGDPMLADAAATARRQWTLNPVTFGNVPRKITCDVKIVFRPDGSVDTSQTASSIGVGSVSQNEFFDPGGFPKPEDFLIGEPPDGLAALSEEAMPEFVRPTEIPRDR